MGVQILPFQQITAKDEFINIKNATRDDILAAHRIPPQLMGAMPEGNGSFGGYRESRSSLRYQRTDTRDGSAEGGQRVDRRRSDPL